MTLVELLVAVVILGILSIALVSALVVAMRSTNDTQTSLAQSNGEQLLAHYLQKDVNSACDSSPVTTSTIASVPTGCGAPNPTATAGCDPSGAFTVKSVSTTAQTAAQPTADVMVTYSVSSGTLQRAVSGGATTTLATNVNCIDASYPSSGACNGQFRVQVQTNASTKTNGPGGYTYAVCAHARAS
jgi:type II secretory pathway pseudopilin PulG